MDMPISAKTSQTAARLWKVEGERMEERDDRLATEEPLEIRLRWGGERRTVAVTMRTPGNDFELAAGFLFAEGVIEGAERIRRMFHVFGLEEPFTPEGSNVIEVELKDGPEPPLQSLERHFFTTSACGVCGKAGLETLRLRVPAAIPAGPSVPVEVIRSLPARLREAQSVFAATGGLHAAGLFDAAGELLAVREDVGRHNALDKLIGWALRESRVPLHDRIVLVSGRSSYEILQKSVVAGVPFVCAVSAPSSLAVEIAEAYGLTLVGFLRDDRFNVYSGPERIAEIAESVAL